MYRVAGQCPRSNADRGPGALPLISFGRHIMELGRWSVGAPRRGGRRVLAALGALLAAGVVTGAAAAGVSTQDVLKRTLAIVALEESRDNQVLFIQVDVISRDVIKSQTYTLPGGSRYRVYAIGDGGRIADLDLEVRDSDNDLVKKDDDDSNVAIVEFRVARTEKFTFKVDAAKMKPGAKDGFYGLVVVRLD
jgi:hypothetical protein